VIEQTRGKCDNIKTNSFKSESAAYIPFLLFAKSHALVHIIVFAVVAAVDITRTHTYVDVVAYI